MSDFFKTRFQELTGRPPLSWQTRLYESHFATDKLPPVIDLPTGLGKTMVMAIWWIARMQYGSKIPTRLIYVVDRRTVVDQASDLAEMLRKISGEDKLAVSTLRGQLADNREWSRAPSRPAIIIGTVDLIGSALLFSGYRSNYKRRPLEAGLLGQDSLLVLDEAHLSKPFEKLILSIKDQQEKNDKPMRVICMSATSGQSDSQPFQLVDTDFNDSIIRQRYNSAKRLTVIPLDKNEKVNDALAKKAIELAEKESIRGKRIVVFVRKPDDAKTIANAIREHVVEQVDDSGAKPKKVKSAPYESSVEVLTGTMRGFERDELVDKTVFKERWLNGDLKPDDAANQEPVFLVSTSAGEVGFDLNADHLVGDAAPLDSWIQRLGRVNRRGEGDATVVLIKEQNAADKIKSDFDKACYETSERLTDGMNASPKELAAFKKSLTCEELKAVCSPEPTTVELTDILLDAWSMTSIIEPMPGRPEVGPWLRGIAEELPQTTIAWRAELDLAGFAELDTDTIEEWFDTHRILTHETLSVPTQVAAKQLLARWEALEEIDRIQLGKCLVIVERAGQTTPTVADFIAALERDEKQAKKTYDTIRNANLVLPASFGGIERGDGLLDSTAPKKPEDAKDADTATREENAKKRRKAPDIADERGRYRDLITKTEHGEEHIQIGSGKPIDDLNSQLRSSIVLKSDDDMRMTLVSYVPRKERPEFGTNRPETLASHVGQVRKEIDAILERITLPAVTKKAAQLAADFHDHGKNRERWQRLLGFPKPDEPMGKSGGEMKRDPRGYRHEFGSLREFADAMKDKESDEIFDLAMHLIATHHGRGRPHFPKGGFDPDCEARSDEIHTDAMRRFARLQRKYGWWYLAWLENLLRCADALASANTEVKP